MNIRHKKILIAFSTIAIAYGVNTIAFAAKEEAKATKEAPKDSKATDKDAKQDKAATKEAITLTADEKSNSAVDLPSIDEIYRDANKAKITNDWGKLIKLSAKDYSSLTAPNKAFEAGKTLSDVAFITVSAEKEIPPAKEVVEIAYNTLAALELPTDIKAEIQLLKEQVSNGSLAGKELRKKMDTLLAETVSKIEQDTNPAIKDSGSLVLAAGYFKVLYLGALTVSAYDKPTPEQLQMFKWDNLTAYFLDYFTNKASAEYKDNASVKSLVAALQEISPIVNKKREDINKDDVAKIAKALMPLFG
jgi:hypothetical protein